jgi:succinoglycan biosynthesis protein ExoA
VRQRGGTLAGVLDGIDTLPSISFIVPARDEERHLATCVGSLLTQDYPSELIEVLIVDGASADRTREIADSLALGDARVRVLDNPDRITAAAFNQGLAAATSEVMSIVSAHSRTDRAFARHVADALHESGAHLVGGRTVSVPAVDSAMARAICRATSSPFGLGNARHHYADEPGWIDTGYPSAYRRALVDQIGSFDETLIRNQDDEYHLRARRAGFPMWYDPRLQTEYFPRSTVAAVARQYFEYGYWRAFTLAKHRTVASARHLVPAAFVAGVAAGPIAARRRSSRLLWRAAVAAYGMLLVTAGARQWRRAPRDELARFVVVIAVLHTSYGLGFWRGTAALVARATHVRGDRARGDR